MRKSQDNQSGKVNYSPWVLITQYPLSENSQGEDIDAELMASPLNTTMHKLGLAQERIQHIFVSVSRTAIQARSQFLNERSNLPVTVNLFCQRKILANTLRQKNTDLSEAPIRADSLHEFLDLNITLESTDERNSGGWGYFIIERGADLSITYQESPCVLELYLYREVD